MKTHRILLEDEDIRIFSDFGVSLADEANRFCGHLTPKRESYTLQ